MLHRIKPYFEKVISPICYVFEKCGISPNAITIMGLVLVTASSAAFALRKFYLAVILLFIGGILDGVDGKVARDTNAITRFGGFLDSVMDRFSEIAIGLGILYSYRHTDLFELAAFLIFISMTGALMTSYVRARGHGVGYDPKQGLMQRADRGVLLSICALISHQTLLVGVGIVAIAGYITVFQRMYLVWKVTKRKTHSELQS